MRTLLRLLNVSSLVLCLALVGVVSPPLHSQDFKVSIGGTDSEQAKTEKELADKLPPDQAAAYLKNLRVWSTIGETVQWLAALALPVGIVAIVLTFRHRRQKLAHETMRLMIEKGLPVPMELINPPPPVRPPKSDLRRGLIWLAIGIGSAIFLLKTFEDSGLWALGLIPAFIGVAYLLCWVVELARERREAGHERSGLWPGIFWTLLGVSLAFAIHSLEDAPANWNQLAGWWGVGMIPIGIGLAFLLHALILWCISRKPTTQG